MTTEEIIVLSLAVIGLAVFYIIDRHLFEKEQREIDQERKRFWSQEWRCKCGAVLTLASGWERDRDGAPHRCSITQARRSP